MDNSGNPLPHNGLKRSTGLAIAALLIFGAVAGVMTFSVKSAFAATITTSTDKFYGPSLLRAAITDAAKNTAGDTIIAHVDVKRGSSVLGSKDVTLTNIGSSGTFELFVTTSNTFAPAAPTYTTAPGPFVLRVNTAPVAGNANEQTIDLNGATAADPTAELKDGDSVTITYGGETHTVQFAKSNAVASVDRTTVGDGDNVVVSLTDNDANTDPTQVDSFAATNLVTSSVTGLDLTGAMFKETGQNTNQFELVINVGASAVAPTDGAKLTTSTFPSSTTFTLNDKDVYQEITGALAPYNAISPVTSSITSSKSVTLQNVDGVLSTVMPITLGNGIQLQINDADRNVDTKAKDTIAAGQVTVTVAGVTGTLNAVPLKESDFGSGVFLPDTTDNKIPITVGTDGVSTTGITLSPATIAGDPDITITYNDLAADPSGAKSFQLITKLTHTAGTLQGPSQAGVTDKFSLTINDPDLNTNSKSVDSFIVTFPSSTTDTSNGVSIAGGMGTLTLKAKGAGVNLSTATTPKALTMTFIETDIASGIFTANNIDMSIINAAVSGGLSDGDQIEFKYSDNTESPAQTSTITFNIGKPTATISINRGTIPIPRLGSSDGSKFTVTIADSTRNQNSNSVDTFSYDPSVSTTALTMTKKDGSTPIALTAMAGLGVKTFTETGPNTGLFTADYTVGANTATNADMDSAKLKFTYATSGTTTSASVTLRSYDGTVLSNVSAVQNGMNMTITINDPDLNKDSGTAEQASVTVQGKSDDQTLINLTDLKETGADTGVFTKTITVGKDFKISDLTGNKFSTAFEVHYQDLLASDLSTGVDREFDGTIKTTTGAVTVTPTLVGPGTKMFINVNDPDLNANPAGIDTTVGGQEYIRITSDRSGANTLTTALGEETGANTGIFSTKLTLTPLTGSPGQLFSGSSKEVTGFVLPGDILSIRYTDQKDASGSKATVSQIIKVISADPMINASSVTVAASGSVQLTVTDPDANTDGDAVDSITLKVTSTTDPVGVSVTALETGANTGVFMGTVTTTTGVTTGSVSAKVGDNVMVKYTDKYPADYADRVKQVVDPSKDFTFVIPVGTATTNGGGNVNATTASSPVLKDFSNNNVSEVTVGKQVILSTSVANNQGTVQPFAAIVEVRDADGITQYLQWQTGTLNANGSTNVGLSWTPNAPGSYTIRTFVVSDIAHPSALSQIASTTITVS